MTVYRKLLPTEMRHYQAHLLRLDHEDRYARFAGMVSDAMIQNHCEGMDWRSTLVVGCFIGGELRAALELRTDSAPWPEEAELALSVEHSWQRQGAGAALMRRALIVARNRRIRRIHMICQISNRRMQALARKFDGVIERDGGEASGAIELSRPNQVSLMLEMLDDGTAAFNIVLDRMSALPRGVTGASASGGGP